MAVRCCRRRAPHDVDVVVDGSTISRRRLNLHNTHSEREEEEGHPFCIRETSPEKRDRESGCCQNFHLGVLNDIEDGGNGKLDAVGGTYLSEEKT